VGFVGRQEGHPVCSKKSAPTIDSQTIRRLDKKPKVSVDHKFDLKFILLE